MAELNLVDTQTTAETVAGRIRTPFYATVQAGYQYGPTQNGYLEYGNGTTGSLPFRVDQSGNITATSVNNVISLAPSGDVTGATDAAAITAAVAKLPATGGTVQLSASATWYIQCGQVSINRSGVWIYAPGVLISAVGAGDVIRMFDSSTYSSRTVYGGGILGFPVIDGTNTTGNSAGIHAGDILQLRLDVATQNFTAGTTSKGVWLDNANFWTEQLAGRIYAANCTAHVVFDCTGATTSSGSFARCDLQVYINQSNATFDGVVLQHGAIVYDGALAIRGNFNGSASALTSAVLRITGTVPAGHVGAGNSAQIEAARLEIGVECATGFAHTPTTIVFGAGGNKIFECYGLMDFSAGAAFGASSGTSNVYTFNGVIVGDANLNTASGYPTASTWNFPGGLAIGNFAGAQTLTNNATITTASNGKVKVTNSGNVTGIIMAPGGGGFDGQMCWVINIGTGSVTFAASGTSNVADGASDVIAAAASRLFVWDVGQALWYKAA